MLGLGFLVMQSIRQMDVLLWPGPPCSLSREVFFLFSFFFFVCSISMNQVGKNGEHLCECECTRPKSLADLFFFFLTA